MRSSTNYIARLAGCPALATIAFATITLGTGSDIPPHERAIVLFDGRDLKNFDTFLKDHGLNNDPDQVFRVENGVIHVSGKEFGYMAPIFVSSGYRLISIRQP